MTRKASSAALAAEGPERDNTGPRSLTRLLGLFDVLSLTQNGMSLAELSVTLAAPKSSLLNLLRPLVAEGYLIHSEGSYRIGPSIIRLSASVMSAWDFPKMIRPFMEELVERTGETVLLGVLNREAEAVAFVELVNSPHPVRLQVPVGTVRPLYASPTGWLLLAYADKSFRDPYMASVQFKLKMPAGIARASITREMAKIRTEGVCSSLDTPIAGVGSVIAPVFDGNGECIASLTVAGPADRFRKDMDSLRSTVKEVAARASGVVGAVQPGMPPISSRTG
jgi:DNA-binding IclR family transcriptional regulator